MATIQEIKRIALTEFSSIVVDAFSINYKLRLVMAWAELRKEELLADWQLASNGELPFKIDPLK